MTRLVYGSVCSGIEAATAAWHPLGWRPAWFSEIEAFPRAVLAHRYPTVPCHGDFRNIPPDSFAELDLLVGGTPCQAFSVAGLRRSLSDDRGNLSLQFVKLADNIDAIRHTFYGRPPTVVVWENVPGVLNTRDNAFGCFLGALVGEDAAIVPPGGKWTNAGMVAGPARAAAWRVLDAQYFGLAQRRKRVFVVASSMERLDPSEVLFEPEGLRRYSAPGREARQIAPTIPSRSTAGGGLGTDFDLDGGLIQAFGGNNTSGPIDVATALNASHTASGRQDFETETSVAATTLRARDGARGVDSDCTNTLIAHTLRAEGFDASEDGTGRGIPLVPVAYRTSGNCGAWDTGDRVDALTTGTDPNSHLVMTAFALRGRDDGAVPEVHGDGSAVGALRSAPGGSSRDYVAATGVRRLMPIECERLQGFPDGYTMIPMTRTKKAKGGYVTVKKWRRCDADEAELLVLLGAEVEKRGGMWLTTAAADGPRYKALGNSMAVPCMAWIGRRIAQAIKAPSRTHAL